MEITIKLDSEHAAQLEYIQQHSHLDTATLITSAIEREYQQLQPSAAPVNPLRHSSFVGCFQSSPDLATNSKAVLNDIMTKQFPPSEASAS